MSVGGFKLSGQCWWQKILLAPLWCSTFGATMWWCQSISIFYLILIWGFPRIGLPLVIIHFRSGFSLTKTIQLLGYPHDCGNHHVMFPKIVPPISHRSLSRKACASGNSWNVSCATWSACRHRRHRPRRVLRQRRSRRCCNSSWTRPWMIGWMTTSALPSWKSGWEISERCQFTTIHGNGIYRVDEHNGSWLM